MSPHHGGRIGWKRATMCADIPELPTGHPVHPKGRRFKPGCGDTWRMTSQIQHCVRCHQTFGSPAAADLHDEGGEGRCRTGAEVGLTAVENQWGTIVWRNVESSPPLAL